MYSFYDYHFWLSFLIFFIVAFFSFYLPGVLLLSRFKLKPSVLTFLLANVCGFALWGIQGYIFGYLNIRWMTYVYLIAVAIFSYQSISVIKKTFIVLLKRAWSHKFISFFILIGTMLQLLSVFGSGMRYKDGIRLFGANNVDGVLHLSFIQEMVHRFPPVESGAYQLQLQNYHYWIDLVTAELARVWHLPVPHIFFQFLPLYISFFTAIAAYMVVRVWGWSRTAALWSLFLLYLGGDAAYLFMLALHKTFGFYTPAIDNGITQFLNMPHASAKMIFLTGLIPLFYWIRTNKFGWGIITVLLFAPLVGFKIYFGLFAAIGFSLLVAGKVLHTWWQKRKENNILQSFFMSLKYEKASLLLLSIFALVSVAIYLPPNHASGGLGFYPLEWPKLFLGAGNLDLKVWWLRMQVYQAAGNTRNIIILESIAIIITLISVYGTRLLGFWPNKKMFKTLGWELFLFFVPGVLLFQFLGLYTLQASGGFNVFNFFVVSAVIMSLFASFTLAQLSATKSIWAKILVILFIFVTVPRAFHETTSLISAYLTTNGSRLVANNEVEALFYVRDNTPKNAIIQTHPGNARDKITPYVSAFSDRLTYLTGEGMMGTHDEPIEPLQKELRTIFGARSTEDFAKVLRQHNISYLYLQKTPDQALPFALSLPYFTTVYENASVIIVKRN